MKHIGSELYRIIGERRLVKRELAAKLGMDPSYLGQLMHRESLDAKQLERICKAVGISPAYFFDDWPYKSYSFGDVNNSTVIGDANLSIGSDNIVMERLLEEKERTIQILLSQLKANPSER